MENSLNEAFGRFVSIMYRLRKECPWDRKQTPESLRQYLIEESYEVIDSIDQGDWRELQGELGDLLLQIIFQSIIAEENGRFTLLDVLRSISGKMISRHPHVFGDVTVNSAEEVKDNWEHIKHRDEKRESILSGVPESAPALLQAQRLQEKAATVGFDWQYASDVLEKLKEEVRELDHAIESEQSEAVKDELGDILFTVVNLARFHRMVAEDVLRLANKKFSGRFKEIERHYRNDLDAMRNAGLEELDKIWDKVKGDS